MELRWLGGSAVRLGGQRSRVYMEGPAAAIPAPGRGLMTVSRLDGADTGRRPDGSFLLLSPGEYEVDEVFVIGIATGAEELVTPVRQAQSPSHEGAAGARRASIAETLFNVNLEGVNVLHAGSAASKPSQAQVDELGAVDVLVLPLGAVTTAAAQAWISLLQPAIVVPLADGDDGADRLRRFLDAVGASASEPREALQVQAGNLPEDTLVVVLSTSA